MYTNYEDDYEDEKEGTEYSNLESDENVHRRKTETSGTIWWSVGIGKESRVTTVEEACKE